jgi:hypothetical protein
MRKKFVKVMLFGALALSAISYVGCKDYDDDIDGLQQQVNANKSKIEEVEAAMKAGKFIVSYTAITNGYELALSDGSTLTITNGKDGENGQPGLDGNTVIPKFRVSDDNFWQVSTDDGKTYEYVLDEEGNKVNATGQKGEPGEPGQDASANVSINKDGYIVIGDVVTTLKTDTHIPSIVINEVDGLYVINLDGKEYKMLAEGSAYNGLQSVVYRKQAADDSDDFVQSISLMASADSDAELLATSASVATFKIWPTTMDLGKATFAFTDTYKTRAVVPALKYVEGSAKWVDNREGILSVNMTPENIEVDVPYASSLDITINGYTTASNYFNFKAVKWTPDNLTFIHTKDSVEVPVDDLSSIDDGDFSSYVEYTFVYDKSYNLNDSVALGHGEEEKFVSMADLGFSGITVEFKQTEGKGKGIFEIKDGIITTKSDEQASAINELCYVTATYKNEKGVEINSYNFAVKAVREQQVAPALVDIDVETKDAAEAGKLADLQYSTNEQRIELNVRSFLNSLGGRDYMSDNENLTPVQYGLYYQTVEDGKTYANKVDAYILFTPGETTDKDLLELIFPAETVINGEQQLYSFQTWPAAGTAKKYEITSDEDYSWRKSTTTHSVNGTTREFTLKLKELVKCERKVIIKQIGAFVVDGKTTITGAWDETNHSFTMTANLKDLYAAYNTDGSKSSEEIEYYVAPKSEQSQAVQNIYDQIEISNNVIKVSPIVNVKTLGAIKIGARIENTDIDAIIENTAGEKVSYCEPVLRSPLGALISKKSSISWNIDGAENKSINVGEQAEISMLDTDINVSPKNTVIEKGKLVTPWAAAYGIEQSSISYEIVDYSTSVKPGTYTITNGVITCNNTTIVQSVDIYVKVTVRHNWGIETIEKITVKASLK